MASLRCLMMTALVVFLAAAPMRASAAEITVDTAKQYQTIEGFGTCLIAWVDRYRELCRTEEFQRVYVNDLGFDMLRVNLWGPVCPNAVEDWREIRWQDFDMSVDGGRGQVFLDFGNGICKLNPDVKIIGTVWSPPPWMKVTGQLTDTASNAVRANSYGEITNRVKPECYMHFAKWLVEMVKLHEAAGAPLYAVSPGNEVQFTQRFESCVWDGPDYARIVGILGKMLEEEGYGHVKIFGPETMTSHFYEGGTPDYIRAIMSDPEAAGQLDVFATHGYADNGFEADVSANSSREFWAFVEQYGKPFWITEGGTGGHDWPTPLCNGVATGIHNALVAGNVSAYVPWQVIGSRDTHHLMVYQNGQITYTPKTYAVMHYSRFIRPGAVRVDASPAYGAVQASAFKHEAGGALTIVLLNPGEDEQPVTVRFAQDPGFGSMELYRTSATEGMSRLPDAPVEGGTVQLTMPPLSMVTLHHAG